MIERRLLSTGQTDGRTDGRTDTRPLHRPCTMHSAGSVNRLSRFSTAHGHVEQTDTQTDHATSAATGRTYALRVCSDGLTLMIYWAGRRG